MRGVFVSLAITCLCLVSLIQARQSSVSVAYVIDAVTKLPIEGATLRVVAPGKPSSGPRGSILASAATSSDGSFQLRTDVAGVLEIAAPGHATKRLSWPVQNLREIALETGATITFNVSDEAGTPLPTVLMVRTLHPGNVVTDAVRVEAGAGQFIDVPSGSTTIVARSEGFAPRALGLKILPGRRYGPLQLTLSRAASVQGIILDAAGRRLPQAMVALDYAELPFGSELRNLVARRKSADGDFELRNIVPGVPVRIYAEYQGRRSPVLPLVLAPGEERAGTVLILN